MKRGTPKNRAQFESAYCACVCAQSNSATLWTVAHQAPPSMGFSCKNTGMGSFPFSRESPQPKDQTQISHIAGRFFTS